MTLFDRLSAHNLGKAQRKSTPFHHSFNVEGITNTINNALASAGLETKSGLMRGVTDTIHNAFSAAGLHSPHAGSHQDAGIDGSFIEGTFRDIPTSHSAGYLPGGQIHPPEDKRSSQFLDCSYRNNAGSRTYKLYIPELYYGRMGEKLPLVVMLHGCTQSPDDFAAGTQMNALADQHGFLVAYPCQSANANGSKCWNWFRAEDQHRDRGEPSIIAGITSDIASCYRIDKKRIFIAGLSAGAAMAVILGNTYPELFAGVGAHSGLPYGAAHDVSSAFAAMKSGTASGNGLDILGKRVSGIGPIENAIPTIMFHGDADNTVNIQNGTAIIRQAMMANKTGECFKEERTSCKGRGVSRTVYKDVMNQPVVEQWILHCAGHAWSGGSPAGSYTDSRGPDASAEMIRFFFSLKPLNKA